MEGGIVRLEPIYDFVREFPPRDMSKMPDVPSGTLNFCCFREKKTAGEKINNCREIFLARLGESNWPGRKTVTPPLARSSFIHISQRNYLVALAAKRPAHLPPLERCFYSPIRPGAHITLVLSQT
jgi:hypothetical protein